LNILLTEKAMTEDNYVRRCTRRFRRASVLGKVSLVASLAAAIVWISPMLLVTFGFENIEAAFHPISVLLIVTSVTQNWVFTISGLLLAFAAGALRTAGRSETLDRQVAKQCRRMRHHSRPLIRTSAAIWLDW
jgi:hypothetical protein